VQIALRSILSLLPISQSLRAMTRSIGAGSAW
jgi:hypothetical protein